MSFSISELLVVVLVALLVIKPAQLPEVAHAIGRLVSGLRKSMDKIKKEMSGLIEPVEKISEQKREP